MNSFLIAALIIAVSGFLLRARLSLLLLFIAVRWKIMPRSGFDAASVPLQPDYSDQNNWYRVPNRCGAGSRNSFEDAREDPKPVDVFFVHPTTYLSKESWNAPIDEPASSIIVEQMVLPAQAGIFRNHANIYAPKYRQATLASYFAQNKNGHNALTTAYEDVARAFEEFLTGINKDRPFIIAAHSQGAGHCARLINERVNNSDLRTRMVAAYLVGAALTEREFTADIDNIPLATARDQSGCVIAFDTVGEKFNPVSLRRGAVWNGYEFVPARSQGERVLGFNPISGGVDASEARDQIGPAFPKFNKDDAWSNIYGPQSNNALGLEFLGYETPEDENFDARLDPKYGYLVVSKPKRHLVKFPPEGYHLYDYTLFFKDLEEDVSARIQHYFSA